MLVILFATMNILYNTFDCCLDETDRDGFNRSGFKLLRDYGTGKEYLYKDGAIIERHKEISND